MDEIELGTVLEENESTMPVAALVNNNSNQNNINTITDQSTRPSSTSRPNSTTSRNNPLAPPPLVRQNHHFIDDAKAATINRLLQVTGFLAFVNTIIAICLAGIVGVDVIIGVVLGGIATGIAGMFVSCGFQHLRSFQIRTAIVVVFSILAMACALAEYVAISKIEACAAVSTKGSSAYEYYGQAKYYVDAQTCAANDESASSHCNCVSDQQDCVRISFSGNCNSVLNKAPQLAVACVIVSLTQFAFAVLALIRLILSTCTIFRFVNRMFKRLVNSMGYEPLPVPDGRDFPSTNLPAPVSSCNTSPSNNTSNNSDQQNLNGQSRDSNGEAADRNEPLPATSLTNTAAQRIILEV